MRPADRQGVDSSGERENAESFEAAVREGIARSHQTLRNVSGAWVKEQKVECTDGEITSYQVALEVTFVLDD